MIELLVVAGALAACAAVWCAGPRGVAGTSVAAVLSLFGIATAVATWWWQPSTPFVPPHRPLLLPDGGYVGSAACRSCHPAEHASWHESFHRSMTQVATRKTLVPRFDRLQLDWFGTPVALEWRGDRLWTRFRRGGATPADVDRPVEQITGSHHLQVLWYSTGNQRELAPVPMCFKIEEGIWLPLTAAFVLPPDYRDPPEPGVWNVSCHMCHATNVRPRIDTARCDTEVGELGIACEACHGPGERHVDKHRNPAARFAARASRAADESVVQPEHLDPARSAQTCGQCHSVNVLRVRHHDHWREHGLVYRPGDDLHASNLVVDRSAGHADELRRKLQHNPHFFDSAFWADGEVRVSGREYNGLLRTPCHTHGDAGRTMDCLSCHSMHGDGQSDRARWRNDQLGAGMDGDLACTQCHGELRDAAAAAAHTRHAPGQVRCYDCHMPHTTFGLLKAMRSHTVTSPRLDVELATGRPNACNLCHLDRTLQWAGEHLARWYGHDEPALDGDARDVAAGARWILTGDAGQRAIAAWHFGWSEAQRAAGDDWLAPYLARLLDDPYYAVRFGAARSLRRLPGGGSALAGYDFLAPADVARAFGERVASRWRDGYRGPARPALLLGADGLAAEAFARLHARRNDRPVFLAE